MSHSLRSTTRVLRHLLSTLFVLVVAAQSARFGATAWAAEAPTAKPDSPSGPEEFTGRVNWVGGGPKGPTTLIMKVEKWTTMEERAQLLRLLKESGPEAVVKILDDIDIGMIRAPNTLGWRVGYAISGSTPDGGRIVRLVCARPMAFGEVANATRSADYETGAVELRLNAKGEGEGTFMPYSQIYFDDKGELVVKSLGIGPHPMVAVKKR